MKDQTAREGMRTAPFARLAAAAAAALTACGGVPAPRSCGGPGDCAPDARCIQSVCVADAPPVAVITAPSSFLSNASYVFGASASYDPDPGDSVTGYAWTVSAVQAPCSPEPGSGTADSIAVVFPCAGQFDVALVVRDELGIASPPRALRVAVVQAVDPPVVTVGPGLALAHRCTGAPPVCTPVDGSLATTFRLSATGTSVAGGLTYRWRWQAPAQLPPDPPPSVTFDPSDTDPAPAVAISTRGTAIAGRWLFVVEATDSRGLIAVGTQEVTVENQPPVIDDAGPAVIQVPHVFNPSSPGSGTGTMSALGQTPAVTVSDPDGDPVEAAFASAHSGDGSNSFMVQDLGDRADFSVVVLYRGAGDGAFLIGPGVARSVTLTASDVNGGSAAATWEIQVTNRKPRVATALGSVAVPHSFDQAGSRYLATAVLSSFADDDGDPLSLDAATGSPVCSGKQLAPATPAAAEVECATPYTGTPAANAIAGLHAVTATVRDAWESVAATTNLTVGNRGARLVSSSVTLYPECTQGTCCLLVDQVCEAYRWKQAEASASAPSPLADDDGDPLLVTYASQDACVSVWPASQICGPGGCAVQLGLCAQPFTCQGSHASGLVATTATDGDVGVAASFTVEGGCG